MGGVYACVITASTIGFGDICPTSTGAKAYTAILILSLMGAIVWFVGSISTLVSERARQLKIAQQYAKVLDEDLILKLAEDGEHISQAGFVLGMLTACEMVDAEAVEMFVARFAELDVDGSHMLDRNDLQSMVQQEKQNWTRPWREMRRCDTIQLNFGTTSQQVARKAAINEIVSTAEISEDIVKLGAIHADRIADAASAAKSRGAAQRKASRECTFSF